MKIVKIQYYNKKFIHNAICLFDFLDTNYINFVKNGLTHNEKFYAEISIKYNTVYKSYYYYLFDKLYYRKTNDTNNSWQKQAKLLKRKHKLKIFK